MHRCTDIPGDPGVFSYSTTLAPVFVVVFSPRLVDSPDRQYIRQRYPWNPPVITVCLSVYLSIYFCLSVCLSVCLSLSSLCLFGFSVHPLKQCWPVLIYLFHTLFFNLFSPSLFLLPATPPPLPFSLPPPPPFPIPL